jgi:hypothetical protein
LAGVKTVNARCRKLDVINIKNIKFYHDLLAAALRYQKDWTGTRNLLLVLIGHVRHIGPIIYKHVTVPYSKDFIRVVFEELQHEAP